uniref:Calpastatin n=1 Tax=Anas platyrhynchos platyrhynchos TaxID=8840 RepID=A0A493U347_ANAPP
MSENDLLEGLTQGFSCSPAQSAPLPTPSVKKASIFAGKEMDEALDLLSDSLGQREPDPDENKPVVDKVKEKSKSEHRDKLGERDDTIPPDYRELLESGDQVRKNSKPTDESAAIDALSGDFDTSANAPATPQHSKVGHLLLITCKINSFPLLSKSFICCSSGLELSSLECAVKI